MISQNQNQKQTQKQQFKLSQAQITGLNFLGMNSRDLREEIFKAVQENPALEIVFDPQSKKSRESADSHSHSHSRAGESSSFGSAEASDAYQLALENTEAHGESLQAHLMHQLNSMKLLPDEYELSKKLIYNLDKNGCYGSMLSPSTLLDKTRPLQNQKMLERCIERIQKMDPVGICCKTPEESLFIQAKFSENADSLSLFLLDGHLDFLNPPEPSSILNKVLNFRREWHKKSFATALTIDDLSLSESLVEKSLKFILSLNPRPAAGFIWDTNSEYESPDIVLRIEKVSGAISDDDYSLGRVKLNSQSFFQIKYASDQLPELRISPDFKMDKEGVQKANMILNSLAFRESSLVLQGCAIVKAQLAFFERGPQAAALVPLTRHQIASELKINDSTVSRMSAKKGSKYFQTEWGLYPASYFFSSSVSSKSSTEVKNQILKIIEESEENSLSDLKIANLLLEQGIKISRRTVAKYRSQLNLENSYNRK